MWKWSKKNNPKQPEPPAPMERKGAVGPEKPSPAAAAALPSSIKNIIAVASGKGGVGKSTTTVNLAYSLAHQRYKVGILDADIYGPSISMMTEASKPQKLHHEKVVPPEKFGVKIISASMFTDPNSAQIMRGPMAGNLVKQFVNQVDWGDLDFLLIDYPPGTGDIQLSISQTIKLTGAVLVTTPQKLALIDVKKALSMFQTLKVPVFGIVETMSYFICDGCDKKHFLFNQGGGQEFARENHLPMLAQIPLQEQISRNSDSGNPMLIHNHPELAALYQKIADKLTQDIIPSSRPQGDLGSFSLKWQNL